MAVLASSGVWLFVILTGAINGYPTKTALDPRRSYDVETSLGSGWGGPHSGQAKSVSSVHSNPAFLPAADEHIQPNAQVNPVPALYSVKTHPGPVYSGYEGRSPSDSTQSRFGVPSYQGNWAIPPPSPFSDSSPVNMGFAAQPEPLGSHHASPPGYFLPVFQPGELSYEEKTFEHGNYDSESEDRKPPPPPQYLPALNGLPISSPLALVAILDRFRSGYPNIDYMLLTRRFPPGTYTYSTNNFNHGKNQRHDTAYVGPPDSPSKQFNTFSSPRSSKWPRQPEQSVGHVGYGTGDDVTG